MAPTVKLKFKPADKPNVIAWPCAISVPKDGGGRESQQLMTRFEVLSSEEIVAFYQRGGPPIGGAPALPSGDHGLLARVVKGFDEFTDEAGTAVADDVAIGALLKLPYVRNGLLEGYFEMIGGRVTKN